MPPFLESPQRAAVDLANAEQTLVPRSWRDRAAAIHTRQTAAERFPESDADYKMYRFHPFRALRGPKSGVEPQFEFLIDRHVVLFVRQAKSERIDMTVLGHTVGRDKWSHPGTEPELVYHVVRGNGEPRTIRTARPVLAPVRKGDRRFRYVFRGIRDTYGKPLHLDDIDEVRWDFAARRFEAFPEVKDRAYLLFSTKPERTAKT
ncbi:MAG: hypothetical protein FJX67_16085 [Alphaproteobacteria bacterium]|nr:hypothetical protein [Alphaproteobacteria bacterium]